MKKLFVALAAVVLVGFTASMAPAADGCSGPFCNKGKKPISSLFCSKQPLPAFQAAPWYLYWPYNAHFMTPAPLQGAFYGPPGMGNFPVNPYFPAAPGYGYGHPHP
jgi:hypothetical protein